MKTVLAPVVARVVMAGAVLLAAGCTDQAKYKYEVRAWNDRDRLITGSYSTGSLSPQPIGDARDYGKWEMTFNYNKKSVIRVTAKARAPMHCAIYRNGTLLQQVNPEGQNNPYEVTCEAGR